MKGKVKYVFFMIVLVLSVASIAEGDNYIAIPGNVFGEMDVACKDFVVSADTIDIALIPETLWNGANQCDYETIACTDCGTGSYSVLVVGFSKGGDSDKIILSGKEYSYVAGPKSRFQEIEVTYSEEGVEE